MRYFLNIFTNPIILITLIFVSWFYFFNGNSSYFIGISIFVHPIYHILITIILAERFTSPILYKMIDSFQILQKEEDNIRYKEFINSLYLANEIDVNNMTMATQIKIINLFVPTFHEFTLGNHITKYLNDKPINTFGWHLGIVFFGSAAVLIINQPPYSITKIFYIFSYWIFLSTLFNRVSEYFIKEKLINHLDEKYYSLYLSKKLGTISEFKKMSSLFVFGFIILFIVIQYI